MKASRRLVTRAVVQQVRPNTDVPVDRFQVDLVFILSQIRLYWTESYVCLFVCLLIYLVSKTNPPLLGDIRLHFDCRWFADSYCLLYVHDWWCHEEIRVIRDVWSCRPTDIICRNRVFFFTPIIWKLKFSWKFNARTISSSDIDKKVHILSLNVM